MLATLSSPASLLTHTRRASPGISTGPPSRKTSQNARHEPHPLDRNASSVRCFVPSIAMLTASCSGVVPTTSTARRDGRFGTSAERITGEPDRCA